jgi:hypothetical protein
MAPPLMAPPADVGAFVATSEAEMEQARQLLNAGDLQPFAPS